MSFPVTWKFVGKALPFCCTAAAQTFPQHIRAPGPAQHLVPSAFCFPSPDVSMTQSSAGMRASPRRAREKKVGPCFFQRAYTRPGGWPELEDNQQEKAARTETPGEQQGLGEVPHERWSPAPGLARSSASHPSRALGPLQLPQPICSFGSQPATRYAFAKARGRGEGEGGQINSEALGSQEEQNKGRSYVEQA